MENPAGGATPPWLASLPTWLLSQAAAHGYRLISDGLASAGGRGYHFRLLAPLHELGPASQAELSRRSGIHVSDVVAAINELADRGFVTRSPDPADRRRNIVTITPDGRKQLRRLNRRVRQAQDELLAPLSPEERDELVRLLARVIDHHTTSDPG